MKGKTEYAMRMESMVDDLKAQIESARSLLTEGYDSENMEYDRQAVNQAHRVLYGEKPPRKTLHD